MAKFVNIWIDFCKEDLISATQLESLKIKTLSTLVCIKNKILIEDDFVYHCRLKNFPWNKMF